MQIAELERQARSRRRSSLRAQMARGLFTMAVAAERVERRLTARRYWKTEGPRSHDTDVAGLPKHRLKCLGNRTRVRG
jgi:hypothetical protein